MEGLAVAAGLHRVHEDVLAGHEGQLLHNVLLDDLLVDHQARGHVFIEVQDGIHRQEGLADGDALVGRVVQGALEPLQGGGHGGVHAVGNDVAGQGADALAAHGVALIRHGGGTHLMGLEGLFDLLHVAQQAQVGGKLVGRLSRVCLAGIGLAGDRLDLVRIKAHLCGNLPVQFPDLVPVAAKQLQEAGLGAGGSLASQQAQAGQTVVHLVQVLEQLVHPQGGPLAHGDHLGSLVVGVAQGGQGLVAVGKLGQAGQHPHQLVPDEEQAFFHQQNVGVVPHIAAGGPQVDDGHGIGAPSAVGMDVGHNVVAQLLLLLLGQVIVDVVLLPLQLVDLPLGDGQAQFHLRPGQGNPQPAPGGKFLVRGEQIKHLPAGVAGGQRTFICIFSHNIVP